MSEATMLLLIGGLGGGLLTSVAKDWLAGRTGRKQLSHGVLFQAEYEIYRDVWRALCVASQRGLILRHESQMADTLRASGELSDEQIEKLHDLVEPFWRAIREASEVLGNSRPFMSEDVRTPCKELGRALTMPGFNPFRGLAEESRETVDVFPEEGMKAIRQLTEKVDEAIRGRVEEMKVGT